MILVYFRCQNTQRQYLGTYKSKKMAVFNIDLSQLQLFFLVFVRIGAIMMSIPVISQRSIPITLKVGMAMAISIILLPILDLETPSYYFEIITFGIGVLTEIMLGIMIGISVNLIFSGIQLAGQLVGYQMGFAIANVMDPQSGGQASILSMFFNLTAMLIFLVINAHHWFLSSLAESFSLVPLFEFKVTGSLLEHMMRLASNMFIIAVKVAAPVMAALLLASICLGLVARTVPRMNIFLVGMPLKIGMGLIFVAISLPYLASFLEQLFNGMGKGLIQMLKIS